MIYQENSLIPSSALSKGFKITASGAYGGNNDPNLIDSIASMLINKLQNDGWGSPTSNNPSWVCVEFPIATRVNAFTLYSRRVGFYDGEFPADCRIEGSNDGKTFDILHDVTFTKVYANQNRFCEFKNRKKYKFYRLNFSKSQGCVYFAYLDEIDLLYFDRCWSTVNVNSRDYVLKEISGNLSPIELTDLTPESLKENGMSVEFISDNIEKFNSIINKNFKIQTMRE